jgi:hypothetical protein
MPEGPSIVILKEEASGLAQRRLQPRAMVLGRRRAAGITFGKRHLAGSRIGPALRRTGFGFAALGKSDSPAARFFSDAWP